VKVEVPKETKYYTNIVVENTLQLWHGRLGHQNIQYMNNCIAKHNIYYTNKNDGQFFCDNCIIREQQRKSFNKSTIRYSNVGKLVHADVCSSMQKDLIGG